MALLDSFLLEAAKMGVWFAVRTDRVFGSGTAQDPFNGAVRRGALLPVTLTRGSPPSETTREAIVTTGTAHGFQEGDMVEISGVTGVDTDLWNGSFGIYGVTQYGFKYLMKEEPDPLVLGNPQCVHLTFPFDEVMRTIPPGTPIHLGPGVFLTRGFGTNASGTIDERGFQVKSGYKIVGAGMDVTTLQLVGADREDYHYHALGMAIEPAGTSPIAPLNYFEVSDLCIDCNADNQPGQADPGYAPVACGAVRILGHYCLINRVKTINWGTKSLKQGCFVISIIQASARPSDTNGNPIITETNANGIESCVLVEPSKNNARETTVLHIGGLKSSTSQAQAFACAAFIRRNFVDCAFKTSEPQFTFIPSGFITSKSGTQITGTVGTFVGKRPLYWRDLDAGNYVRFNSPNDPLSRWNGFFRIFQAAPDFQVDLSTSQGTTNDSSLVIMGTEFRGIALSSGVAAVVEQNVIRNCWIGGPYGSPLDDSVSEPTTPPTLVREERLDPLNALNTRSLIVRGNTYFNVAVGPYPRQLARHDRIRPHSKTQ